MKPPTVRTNRSERNGLKGSMKLTMTLPKISDIELVALEGLERLGRFMGIGEEKIGEAKLLVTEAIMNALEHAGERNPTVRVEFSMTKKELVILVRDYGKGFAPEAVEDPDIRKKVGSRNKRGWGLKLMKSMSDDFRIESGKRGTKITIKKLLN